MIALWRDFVSVAWWLAIFTWLASHLTVLVVKLVGDCLRDPPALRVG